MTNTNLLRAKINESGYKLRFIAQKCGLSYQSFNDRLFNKTEFKQSEILAIRELLHLSREEEDMIFFAINSDEMATV